ncbi:MAG: hypothetical protein A3C43_08155 [Candidatus Schekmanbacteria bacterium RIFCSPHIGHO2_02_FULL_38_11]|uniref:Glycosyl transferase family 1 domain-containing protein n=1 Tax=Candidatus Schekmanbacteria bacterium RIFCSPLOWO2_12_FULL_38_15 TaxID=1817883 RepID=A0A1F7SM14_9BACT|nr:MAG: hypothetical protein A2043_06800 [Candidatus Schekmanbacteria bacterium GWA2_38_9]OGL49961.1 MAG: hypothetical protein A3H37_12100 [Candidatus Schekmanbacteria bacterium RIFCSPLOWO2_02_FULL_38_14]OGL54597.1 MAG: hypothetical protein A3C43_08155 [Candidatus Schekmanbacteria bacterium RIFCSPHIGHO2_02_FULL_38_11]OGL54813.1 MAG: hypothetical protein A3G31_01720 [Candidatus Schekmanbacteria bacterium RIFCSPLOWO2_12_FULL_38_15]
MKAKIIHIITKLELGGAQQNTLFTVKNLDRDIFEPVLISGTGGVLDEEVKRLEGVRVFFVPELVREINPLKDIIALLKLTKILFREKRELLTSEKKNNNINYYSLFTVYCSLPIVVHTHSSKAGILGRWAARLAGVPFIIHTFHGFGFNDYQNFFKKNLFIFLERLTEKITSRFVCVSRANIKKGKRLGIFIEKKVSLIRSGIEIEKFMNAGNNPPSPPLTKGGNGGFSEEIRKLLKIDKNGASKVPIVGMIACFKPQKAPLDFLKIAAKVKKEVEAKFVLVGDGELRKEIEADIESSNLKDDVILAGWQRDIPQVLKCFDLLLLTSLWEGLPRVIPEAVASNIPVIATDVDGTAEVIQDGVNGYLLKPHNIDGFSEKITYLLKNKTVLEDFRKSGKEILAEFDINEMVKKQEKLYLSLLNSSEKLD